MSMLDLLAFGTPLSWTSKLSGAVLPWSERVGIARALKTGSSNSLEALKGLPVREGLLTKGQFREIVRLRDLTDMATTKAYAQENIRKFANMASKNEMLRTIIENALNRK